MVRFGTGQYLNDLAEAARSCGLAWNPSAARGNIDEACVHHAPATVAHEAQALYQALAGLAVDPVESPTNRARLVVDERIRESLGVRRIAQLVARLEEAEHQCNWKRCRSRHRGLATSSSAPKIDCGRPRSNWYASRRDAGAKGTLRIEARDLLIRSRAEVCELHMRLEHFETHFVLGPALRGRRRLKTVLGMLKSRAAM